MAEDRTLELAQTYLDSHWEDMVADIESLVRIPSFKEAEKATENAPWGPGPRASLSAALELSSRFGFTPVDVQGGIGYADLPGESTTQLGIIGHTDVVPAGPGWHFEPYAVTRKDGYLLGRGVVDDKGPVVVALHAAHLVASHAAELFGTKRAPYTIRFIFGADEECGMGDVPYYRAAQPDPAFTFTPDADFPVCYGEKGQVNTVAVSAPLADGALVAFEGGAATNAVPGFASCVVRAAASKVPATDRIAVTDQGDGTLRLVATGRSAHASLPESGINAIGLLVEHLLAHVALSPEERSFCQFEQALMSSTAGEGVGVAAADDDFGPLTIVGGVISLEDGCLRQTIDARLPLAMSSERYIALLNAAAASFGVTLQVTSSHDPFMVDANGPEIQSLLQAYCQVTGEDAQPFTMGGGTYARQFSRAASFGPVFHDRIDPDWVGGMHGPDEGVAESTLKDAFLIYCVAIANLMRSDLG